MTMLHLRVVCPQRMVGAVLETLTGAVGVVAVLAAGDTVDGTVVTADVAREAVAGLLSELRRIGLMDEGMVSLLPLDTAVGTLADRAERDAPGEGADALIWEELNARTGGDSILTWTFAAFMVLATMLVAVAIVTDSQITLVGAMVVAPEFGPLAAIAVGLVQRRGTVVRRGAVAVVAGFALAITVTALLSLLARGTGLIDAGAFGGHRQTEYIYHPGWFSLITALVAGAAGMISLTSSKSAALVGVFISVTTLPAAGNAALAAVLERWNDAGESLLQLAINIVGIIVAGVLTLLVRTPSDRAA